MSENGGDETPWFRPKTLGYGMTPATWQGWVATVVLIVALVLTGFLSDPAGKGPSSILFQTQMRATLGLDHVHLAPPIRLALMALEVAAFYLFTRWKGTTLKPLD
jgi:hypothetical protein